MQQRLIVEGNDAISIATLMLERKVSAPKGYTKIEKFTKGVFEISRRCQ